MHSIFSKFERVSSQNSCFIFCNITIFSLNLYSSILDRCVLLTTECGLELVMNFLLDFLEEIDACC